MSAGRICLRDVDLAERAESARAAAQRMAARRVGTLVVLGENGHPAGILTDRDLTLRVLAAGRDPDRTTVGQVMTSNPTCISEDTPIESALGLMRAGGFRRLPVVDRQGKLAGILGLDDVLGLLAEEFTLVGDLLEREAPHSPPHGA